MPLHDHENKKEPVFCTLMGEICHSGWTKKMGEVPLPDGATIRPRCHKWVGVYVTDPRVNQTKEVFDCNEQWGADLQQQIAQEIYQNAAATEQVRNGVAEGNNGTRMALAFFQGIAKRMRAPVVMPQLKDAAAPAQIQNGGANGPAAH